MRQPNHTPILRLAALLGLLVLLALCVWPGYADFGDFSGDSDFGGSDYSDSWDDDHHGSMYASDSSSFHLSNFGAVVLSIPIAAFLAWVILSCIRDSAAPKLHDRFAPAFYRGTDSFSDWGFAPEPISTLPVDKPESSWIKATIKTLQDAWIKGNGTRPDHCTQDFQRRFLSDLRAEKEPKPRICFEIDYVGFDFVGWNESSHKYMLAMKLYVYFKARKESMLDEWIPRLTNGRVKVNLGRWLHFSTQIKREYCCVFQCSKDTPAEGKEGRGWLLSSLKSAESLSDKSSMQSAQPTGGFAGWGFRLKSMNEFPAEKPSTAWINDLYRRMQDSWGKGDISSLQKDFTADCYTQFNRQLQAKNKRGEKAHCIVNSIHSALTGWNQDDQEYMLAVEVTAVIIAWNENLSGKIISGSDTKQKEMRYAWVLRRGRDITAAEQHCPSCGSALPLNYAAVCPHCGAQIEQKGPGWALSSIQAISQKTL